MQAQVNGWRFGLLALLLMAGMTASSVAFCPIGLVWPGWDPDWIEPGAITGGGQTFLALVDPHDGCDCPVGLQPSPCRFQGRLDGESLLYS